MTDKHPLAEELRKLADPDARRSTGDWLQLLRAASRKAADELDSSARQLSELRGALEEKADLDFLVAESVSRQESGHFAAEVLRLREALSAANSRASRWEDKVSQYGREMKDVEAERSLLQAQAKRYREALEWYADEHTIAYQTKPNEYGTFAKDNGDRARQALEEQESGGMSPRAKQPVATEVRK